MLHALIRDGNQVAVNDLLSSSQSSNLIFSANQDGETPLHVAAAVGGVDFIPLLLSKGASLEAQETQNGRTPLLVAAAGKQLKVVKKLIECNSHVAATDNDGNTILHLLVQQQQEEIQLFASILRDILARSKININHQNFSGEAPLHLAASAGNESAVLFLINQPSIDINLRTVDQATAVQLAARKGSKSLVNILLGMNCDSSGLDADEQQGLLPIEIVNMRQARTPRGTPTTTPIVLSSPLLSMQISSSSSSSLPIQAPAATISSSSSSSSSSSGYSLSAGLSLSSAKVRRASASLGVPNLGSSSKKLDPETVKRSIANLSSLLVQGTVSDIQKAIKKDKTLLKRRLDNGQTFLHFAIQTGRLDVIKIILDKTIKNINDIDENGNTALHLACMYHYYDIALFLIQQKASVSIANSKGHSALHLMSQKVTKDPANYEKVLKQLVSHGVNVNVPDAMGNAPVHFSAAMGDDSSLFFLHANGADLNTTNLNDHTPLIDAALNKRISTVKLLVSLGAIKTSLLQRIIDEKSTTPAIIEVLAPIELSKSSADNSSARYLVLKKPESSSLEVASQTVSPRSPSSSNSSSPRSAARLSLPISSMSMSSAFSPASPLPLATPSTSDKKSKKVGKGEAIKISSRVLNDDQKIDVTITMIQRGEDFTKYIKRDRFLVNKHSSKGYNLLHFACKAGKLDVVSQLIEKYKADVNIPTINGKSALLIALKEAHMEVVDLLIVRHADPTLISGSGRSAFHYLSQRPVKAQKYRIFPLLKYLADNGLSVNCLEKKTGNSALHIAAQKSDSAMVRMLLGLGANIDALNLQFQSPLLLATLSNNIENAKCLISRGGARALSLSVKNSGETLESAGIPPSLVDLINASSEKEHATIDTDPFISDLVEQYVPYQSLLGIDYSPRRVNSNEKSFEINKVHQIHSLVRQGIAAKLEIFKVLKKDTREVLYFLDDKGLNAIHICAIEGHTELLQAIIEKHHPSLDKKDHAPLGFTALHYAADKGHLKLVKLLVEKGANIKATSAKGETVLHILSELILDRDLVSLYNEIIGLIVHSGAAVDGPDAEGNTPLHRAASIGNPVGLAIFFDSEANVNARNLKNQTPLELACNQNQKTAARLLLSKGANIEWFFGAQPKNGNTSETDSSETEPETPVVPMSRSRSFSIASYDETKAASFGFSADIVALLKARLELLQTGGISSASPIPPQVSSSGSQSSVVPQIVIGHSQTPSVSVPIPAAGGLHSDGLLVDGMAVAGTTPRKDRFRIVPDNVVQFQTFVEEDNRVEIKKFLRKDKEGREMIQSSNRIGQTSVHLAAMHGHLELLETFVDKFKADSSSLDDQGHTALILAAQRGHLDCCIFLLESGAKMGMTRDGKNPVHYVSAMSSSDPVQYHRFFQLVSEKVPESLNGTTFNGDTPLHFAATYGNEQAALFITNSKTAQLDLYNNFGETPLQLAVRCGHAGIARILLRMGASTMGLEYDVSFITDLKEEIYTLLDPLEFQTPSLKALALTERPRDSSSLLFIDHRLTSLGELLDRRLTTRTTVSSTGSARALRSNSSKFLSGNKSAAESNDEGMSEDGRGTSNLSSIEEIAKSIIIRVVTTEPEEQECPSTSDIDEDATSPRPPPLAAGETPATLLAKFLDEQVSQLKGFPEGIVKSARHLYEAICTLHPMTTQLLFADVKHIVSFLDVFEVSLTDLYSFFLSNSNQRPASSSVITLSSYLLPFKKFMETIGLAHSLVKSDFPPESTVADLMEELTASTASSSKTKALSSTEGSLQRFVNLFGQLLGSTDIIEPLEGHSNDISSSFWSLLFDLVNTDVSSDSDLRNYLADPRFDKKQAHNLWTELAGSSTPINKKKFLELFNFEGAQSQMLATSCLAFNSATKAINELKQQYATQTPVDQFKSRLLLREVSRTVEALQTLLDDTQIGMNTEGGMKQGESTAPFVQMINNNITNPLDRTAELLKIEIKRLREAKQALLAPRNSNEILIPSGGSGLSSSSSSGSSSVSSSGSTIESVADSIVQKYKDSPTKILVSREVHAPGKDIDSLSSALTEYMAWSQVDPGCIHSRIEHSSEQSLKKRFVMFQVWDSPTLFASHLNSDHYRRYVSVSGPLKAFENVSITKVL